MSDEPWKFFTYTVCVWRLEGTITIKKFHKISIMIIIKSVPGAPFTNMDWL